MPSLLGEFPDLRLVAIGRDNGMRDPWVSLARRLDVSDHVLFLDYLPYHELVDAYGACDIYVLPSEYEAFGIVLLEAMASRRPVVAADVGGVSDVVVDGETGYLVRYGDRDAMRNALLRLLRDPDLRDRFGRAGRQRVEAYFTWDRVVDMLEEIYRELTL
jgi:glycosyltransferase involved in cell wall biosynthesis